METVSGAAAAARRRLARFGPYEFDAAAQELRKHGLRLKLQGKPLHLLSALIETPGAVVSRDDLQRRLWPADTFVDFENGLNTAAKRLRAALSDSAEQPVYVETLARTGYRFIAPVEWEAASAAAVASPPRRSRFRWLAAAAVPAAFLLGYFAASRPGEEPAVTFRQVTFRRGPVFNARFAPDGRSIVYGAQWGSEPPRIFLNNGFSPESRPLGFEGSLFSVSPGGELAIAGLGGTMPIAGSDLSRVPMNGGAPVLAEKSVMSADWSRDGRTLALVRLAGGRSHLEFPPGRQLYSTAGWLSGVRMSRDGQRIAFIDHPARHDDSGRIRLLDLADPSRTYPLTGHWAAFTGLAWSPDSREMWISGIPGRDGPALFAVRVPDGKMRRLGQFPGALHLLDVSASGALLLANESRRLESFAHLAGWPRPRNISWLDWTRAVELADDGRVLFDESGDAVSGQGAAFLFRPGQGTQRLGEGYAQSLSPDGRGALILSGTDRRQLTLLSFEGEAPRALPLSGLEYQWARYYPDGQSLLALGNFAGQPLRLYRVPASGAPAPVSPPGMVRHAAISPGGDEVAYLSAEGKLTLAVSGRVLASSEPLAPLQWTRDGRALFVQHLGRPPSLMPVPVSRLDIATGRLTPWREFAPADPVGVDQLTRILISPDARSTVFTVRRLLSELFAADGIR